MGRNNYSRRKSYDVWFRKGGVELAAPSVKRKATPEEKAHFERAYAATHKRDLNIANMYPGTVFAQTVKSVNL